MKRKYYKFKKNSGLFGARNMCVMIISVVREQNQTKVLKSRQLFSFAFFIQLYYYIFFQYGCNVEKQWERTTVYNYLFCMSNCKSTISVKHVYFDKLTADIQLIVEPSFFYYTILKRFQHVVSGQVIALVNVTSF